MELESSPNIVLYTSAAARNLAILICALWINFALSVHSVSSLFFVQIPHKHDVCPNTTANQTFTRVRQIVVCPDVILVVDWALNI